jgi:preprotein translocase subunit SecE
MGRRAVPYGTQFDFLRRGRLMAKTSPSQFVREVRQEVSRVTWPTRKETLTTTAMVFVMVFIAAGFFFLVDQVLSEGVRLVFGLGR